MYGNECVCALRMCVCMRACARTRARSCVLVSCYACAREDVISVPTRYLHEYGEYSAQWLSNSRPAPHHCTKQRRPMPAVQCCPSVILDRNSDHSNEQPVLIIAKSPVACSNSLWRADSPAEQCCPSGTSCNILIILHANHGKKSPTAARCGAQIQCCRRCNLNTARQ